MRITTTAAVAMMTIGQRRRWWWREREKNNIRDMQTRLIRRKKKSGFLFLYMKVEPYYQNSNKKKWLIKINQNKINLNTKSNSVYVLLSWHTVFLCASTQYLLMIRSINICSLTCRVLLLNHIHQWNGSMLQVNSISEYYY